MLGPNTSGNAVSLQEHPELPGLLQDGRFREELRSQPTETLGKLGILLDSKEEPESVELPHTPNDAQIFWAGLI